VIHALNGILLYKLANKIFSKFRIAVLSAILFIITWTHFYELTWISSTFNSISLLFILLYLNSFGDLAKKTCLAELFLVLALFSVETAVIAPFLLILILLYNGNLTKTHVYRILMHGALVIGYLSLRFFFFRIPATNSYQLIISPAIIKNILIFILWLFNFPEAMTTHFTFNRYNFTLTDDWFSQTFPVYSISLSLLFYLSLLMFMYFLMYKRKTLINKFTIFCSLWFFIALLPILFIPNRTYPYYPFLSQIAFWFFIAYFIISNWRFLLVKIFFVWFLVANFFTVSFVDTNHWIFAEASHPEKYVAKLKSVIIPNRKKYVYFRIDSIQEQNALNHGLGLNTLLNDYGHVFFLSKDSIPSTVKANEIFDFEDAYRLEETIKRYKRLKMPIPPSILEDQKNLYR
jgi:hypothetical protein